METDHTAPTKGWRRSSGSGLLEDVASALEGGNGETGRGGGREEEGDILTPLAKEIHRLMDCAPTQPSGEDLSLSLWNSLESDVVSHPTRLCRHGCPLGSGQQLPGPSKVREWVEPSLKPLPPSA